MATHINLGDISAEVVLKDVKNVHLSVYPPDGKVRISAPAHMGLDTLRIFAISRLPWIRQQQDKLRAQARGCAGINSTSCRCGTKNGCIKHRRWRYNPAIFLTLIPCPNVFPK